MKFCSSFMNTPWSMRSLVRACYGRSMDFGGQSAVATLRRALVRPPHPDDIAAWRDYGWMAEPDPERIVREHKVFREVLAAAGTEVILGETRVSGDPDAAYACDPVLMTDLGALLLRPGKEGRRREPEALGADLQSAGVPVAGVMDEPATAEGGDLLWLDRETLAVGRSYRTNDQGVEWLRKQLPDVQVLAFDLPHLRGPGDLLHLLSLISLLDEDLAVVYPSLLPARLVELLSDRGVQLVEVPDEEFGSHAPNVLALGPRRAVMLDGNPGTRRRLEAAGVELRTYPADELAAKGLGGPTCLTVPILRG
jgi:dimethylargininase